MKLASSNLVKTTNPSRPTSANDGGASEGSPHITRARVTRWPLGANGRND